MRAVGCFALLVVLLAADRAPAQVASERRLLYVAAPGIRNYVQYGGQGLLVFDIDQQHQFVKRIDTPAGKQQPANIKGICASAGTGLLYETTPSTLYCMNFVTEQPLWEKKLPQGCDRMAMTPDGKKLYVPSFEKQIWNVVDAISGELIATIANGAGTHNTICSLDGKSVYLAGLKSPILRIADTMSDTVIAEVGPFSSSIRPFTINAAQTRCYACVNDLLGFEIGDLTSRQVVGRVVVDGFSKGAVKRHGCPAHGIGLRPDEKEIWLCDGHNERMHVFDLARDPPVQIATIALREQPGWVMFSLDGRYAYSSTGEVIDTGTKQIVATLTDETGTGVHSEKMVEIHFRDGQPVRVGDQFGLGRAMALSR